MDRIIGPASDFYRLRLTHLDLADEPEFDWREDILWRAPAAETPVERDVWLIEVVSLDGADTVTRIRAFEDADEARDVLGQVEEDLSELTKSQFEAAYLSDADS